MATCSISFRGQVLQQCRNMDVLVPDNCPGPLPVLYLLHGLSDNQTVWNRLVPLADVAGALPLIVVMPDGGRGFYVNNPAPGGSPYEDHIVSDVVGFVDRVFPTIPTRQGRAIAGNSMGGYGAIMLALRHPDVFAAAVGHAGAYFFAHGPRPGAPSPVSELAAVLPAGKYDCFRLAEAAKAAGNVPAIRLDCGAQDVLVDSSRQFHAHLTALGIDHEYAESPGEHCWQYWRQHVGETLEFVMRHVGAKEGNRPLAEGAENAERKRSPGKDPKRRTP
jgi:putative tributyrin esterase